MNRIPIITLLTDFGQENGFTGVMKGVMLQIAPQACLIDITHELPPFSISAAAFLNDWSFGYFPAGSVHLCVVDPGVGTQRRVLTVETSGHFFVAPDNGLLTPILQRPEPARIVHATRDRYWLDKISNTFHGRDIFAPLAAYLANGVPLTEFGPEVDDPILLSTDPVSIQTNSIDCHVCYIDRFGNLITNLDQTTYRQWCTQNNRSEKETSVHFQDQTIQKISQAYGERSTGEFVAIFDGYDRLEIAVSGGSAAITTGLGIDAPVQLRFSRIL